MTIQELNALPEGERITQLKKYPAKRPDTQSLIKDWDYTQHDVFDEELRPKRRVLVKEQEENKDGTIKSPAQFRWEDVNRMALPLEQDIVNIHTAFTVGTPPKITANVQHPQEQELLDLLTAIHQKNKLPYDNKRIVRSWFAECEVAEYWYVKPAKEDDPNPTYRLKSMIWSPFRGDTLYPYYDEYGDLIAFSREYNKTDSKGIQSTRLMVVDNQNVTIYSNGTQIEQYPHGFSKIPVIYMKRERPLCDKIRTLRNRLEVLLSNFADCLDYNFYPKMVASGEVVGVRNKGMTSEIIQLENDAQVSYLTWQQSPDMAKLEFDNLTSRCYALTNTPQITFEALQGIGNALSGKAFKFMFMGTHMAVSNHAETIEEFLQRRINFLLSAIGSLIPKYAPVAKRLQVNIEIVPYMIDSLTERIADAVSAVQGGVASLKEGIILAGITDKIDEELAQIEKEKGKDVFSD
ncbi:phage portal protein [Capnocytophaga granulosa]|uniref:phage portal protein n=1 Tax=Capnocytophaga granulosa TaxID=45242 RepID=UPI0028EFD9C6|nr:phage portal protein [Capnocytophaga granulosa]